MKYALYVITLQRNFAGHALRRKGRGVYYLMPPACCQQKMIIFAS